MSESDKTTTSKLMGMTGFGRAGGEAEWGNWTWEAKSVNGRGLDVRVNVPSGFDGLDHATKKKASGLFSRGNMQISLRIELAELQRISVNQAALDALCDTFEARSGAPPEGESLAALMAARGVLDMEGSNSGRLRLVGKDEQVRAVLLAGVDEALARLVASRQDEGQSLHTLLSGLLDQMDEQAREAEIVAADQPAQLKHRLVQKLRDIASEHEVDSDRLAAEAALAAAKSDVREELDRLAAHIETGRKHLSTGHTIGRKLDFLAQELNREANTLCAKSASLALTNAGLALKILIDQFKEQAANVE
jgi:uncharacterized protein (TIGR00255 family)